MRRSLVCAVLLALALAVRGAWARQPEPDSYVLLVGIEQCGDQDDYSLSRLAYARQDLDRMRDVLPYLDGFASPEITELWQEQAVKANVLAGLEHIRAELAAHPERSALVYFTGHGLEVPDVAPLDEEDGFDEAFVLYDFPLERHPPSAETAQQYLLLDDDLARCFDELPDCRRFIFISDSCHAGGLPKDGGASEADAKRFEWPELAERGLVTAQSELIRLRNPSELVILAAQDGESALVSNKHQSSVLTYALHRALVDDAATCDRNGDGRITLDELRFYLAGAVDQVVQDEYNMKGQQVQIASGAGSGPAIESSLEVARSSALKAMDAGSTTESYWTPLAISYTAQLLSGGLAKLGEALPTATAEYRFAQPVRSGGSVAWTLKLDAPASIAVVSFDGKGNATVVTAEDYGPGVDWTNVPAGTIYLPGGVAESVWGLRFERRGLEFAAVILLPPGKTLSDYMGLSDAVNFGYRKAVAQAAKDAAGGASVPARDAPQASTEACPTESFPGLLILPYEVQP